MARSARILSPAQAANAVPITVGSPGAAARAKSNERVIGAPLVVAHLQAKALLEQAEQRAEREYLRRLAELEAREQERTERFEQACRQREEERMLREIAERNAALNRQQEEVMTLGCLLAERLLGAQLRLMPSAIFGITQEVLREARGAKKMSIFAAPADKSALMSVQTTLAEQFLAEIELFEDPSLGSGDLIIESELGSIKAKIKARLTCLLEMLRQSERT